MPNMTPITSVKNKDKSRNNIQSLDYSLNKTKDMNNIIVMSGSAKRKRLGETETQSEIKPSTQINFKEKFMQLQTPFEKPRHKQGVTEEKVMTKSCEILFECIKPYKDISVGRKTKVAPPNGAIRRIFTTDIIYERKATRKVQFFEYSGHPMENVFSCRRTSLLDNTDAPNSDTVLEEIETGSETDSDLNQTGKTVSSADFITDVFSDPKPPII